VTDVVICKRATTEIKTKNKDKKMRAGLSNGLRFSAAIMAVIVFCVSLNFLHSSNVRAASGINQQLNFQGRLLDNTGAVVADGSYNMEFKIYQDGTGCVSGGTSPCGGTLKWTEDWVQTNRVSVKNGYFSVNLGSITAFGSNIDWNQDTLWLSTNIGGTTNTPTPTWDGEMTPFKRLASSPYALNSAQLGGLTAANFVQLAQGIQTDSSTVNPSIFINKTGATANILELQKSNSDVFTVANSGDITATGKYNTDTINSSTITFGASSTANIDAASGQTLQLGASSNALTLGTNTTVASGKSFTANGSALFEINSNSSTAFQIQSATAANTLLTADTNANKVVIGDATGTNTNTTELVVDSSTADPTTGYNGAIYYNSTSNKFRCYQGSVWADCLAASGNGIASFTAGLANVTASQTGLAVQNFTISAAAAISTTGGVATFTAPAGGSFRACQLIGDANTTAGTISVRWRVNGASVGSAACTISTASNRTASTALDDGTVTFSQGDTIGIAFDTNAAFAPATTDFVVYWSVEYNSVNTAPSGATLQSAYNNNPVLTTTDAHDLVVNAADTTTDANVLFNLQCVTSCSTNGRFAVQNAGADVFSVAPNSGNVAFTPAGTGSVVVTSDNDSNLQINSTFTGTGPSQTALAVTLTDNATAAGTSYGLSVTNADNAANVGVPAALAYLKNANAAETVPDGLLVEQTGAGTLTNGAEIKQTAGAITNGLTFTGTFTSVLKVGSTTVLNGTGVVQSASISGTYSNALTLSNASNAYTGATYNTLALNGQTDGFTIAGGTTSRTLTVAGANITVGSTITPTAAGALIVQANGSNALTLTGGANSTWSTTAGALTITSNQAATWSTANGALTLQSASGTVSFGTSTILSNSGANLTLSSSGGSDVALNSNVQIRPGTDSTSSVQFENSSATATIASIGTNTTPANQNLVSNPSLENNANGWVKKGNAGDVISSSDDFAQYGSRSLKIVTTANAGDGASYSLPLKASTQYTLSAWIRLSAGTATTLNLNRQDNGADVDACTSGNGIAMSVTTTFTQFTCTFTTGATVNGTTNIYVKQTDGTIRTIYVDGVTLVASASGLTYVGNANNLDVQSLNSTVTLNAANSGDIQPWQLSSTPLTTALRYGESVTANGYIYYVGGCTTTCATGTQVATVYYAKINADGSMGTWSSANALPAARYGMTLLYINGYMYAIGGDSGAGAFGATPQSTIYYTKMNNDGTVGTWQTAVNTLPAAREFQTSMAVNGFIYAIGGDNAGAQSTVYYAKAQADGSISGWNTATALTTGAAARRYASTVVGNGFVYVIGGDTGGTAQNTVYYDSINSDGTLGATWASTTAIAVGGAQIRRHQTSVVVNGYVYVIGGDNGTTTQSTVYYAKLLPDGTVGAWQAASNALPAARYGQTSLVINGYIYALGGYDGTNPQATPYYASTERVLVAGSLDLVGLSGQSLSDAGGAGSITAGNIRAVGGLTVDGYADFNNGISVDSALNINAVSASAGQVVLNINNLNSNSIFSVRHMSTNFGSLVTAGAFMQKDSYFGEEYNISPSTATQTCSGSATQTDIGWDRGDGGSHQNAAVTCGTSASPGAGDFNFSSKLGNATAANDNCSAAFQTGAANGVERLSAVSTANNAADSAVCFEGLSSTQTTTSKIYAVGNLPVMEVKVKMNSLATGNNNTRAYIGMGDKDNSATNTSGMPSNGAFFSNCSTYSTTAPTGCSTTNWYGIVAAGGAQIGATLTCSTGAAAITANFSYLRIEVRATNDIHFFADYNTTDGINESECGAGNATSAAAMTATAPFFETAVSSNIAQTTAMDVDYIRSWQDDNITTSNSSSGADSQAVAPLTPVDNFDDTFNPDSSSNPFATLADFEAATSEDATFSNNVYVKGTIYANKIEANQIEGMDVITDKISSLAAQVAKDNAAASSSSPPDPNPSALSLDAGDSSDLLTLNNLQATNITVLAQLEAKGGLIVDGNATFNGLAQFKGAVSFNNDAGGTAVIKKGATSVQVKFTTAYQTTPIITANYLFNNADSTVDQANQLDLLTNGYGFIVTQTSTKGFTILLNKAADHDTNFSWLATQIDNPQISQSTNPTSSSN